jgi:cobalt/nickel transport system permease protein
VLCVVLPLTTPSTHASELGALTGLQQALGIGVRANAIVLTVTALIATLDIVTFGRALHALRVPPKLVTLLLFTVRYVGVIRAEYSALRRAMRVRCFRPRSNAHTMRTLGNLAGMLLVRGLERSTRVLLAMKCRGYTGRFPLRELTPLCTGDAVLAAIAFVCIAFVAWAEFF